jgi:glucosamine--fructose-6-phosphate aminotransferase (isomerizing)
MEPGIFSRTEIFSQPEAWAEALAILRSHQSDLVNLWHNGHYDQIIFTGCGSPYYAALASAALLQELSGRPARALPASELWLSPRSAYAGRGRTLLIALSRSGETTELLRACEAFKQDKRGDVITVSCYPDRPLTRLGTLNVVLPSGQEESLAQTRAFSTLYLATVAQAAWWSDAGSVADELARLPDAARRLLDRYGALARSIGADLHFDRYYMLGSGPRYGLACELNLKMKEMSLTHSEPFHFMDFRHGPMSMVTPTTAIVGLVSEANRAHELQVLTEMSARGARCLSIGETDVEVAFQAGLSEAARNILYLPIGQLIACERSLAKGLNPDRPHGLNAVVKLP